ncbi:IscS subfamily cysteine desulfurase [Bacillus sp. FJAT-45350]|uniref:IscS subfamily cysteine desulfurase n=1 Tax=Bacillus sp. FJAT-45350 TaxID=2011014 RepID=UPI000BB794CF|nr:IscS subfamily cysteine desulfurase [Bacillus sp. FJAT-45350]
MIYLDHSATTPMSQYSLKVFTKVSQEYFGNPSSLHDYGSIANDLVQTSRQTIAKAFNGVARSLYFTSGGSESNYLSLLSIARANESKGKHLITTPIEHPSIINTFESLRKEGFEVSYIPVNSYGEVIVDALHELIREDTILASIGHANAELGTVQDIKKIGEILNKHGVIFHSDCVQSFGKIPIDVQSAKIDCLSLSAHKIYGPKGIGACYISPSVSWKGLVPNTTHEQGFRQGTINVPGAAAFAAAVEEIMPTVREESERLKQLRLTFLSLLNKEKVVLEGHPDNRLPHHLGLRVKGIEGQYVMLECNRKGIAISTGSACKVGQSAPPASLLAVGRSTQEAHEFIRLTFGKTTTEQHIVKTVNTIHEMIDVYFR